MLTIFLFDMKIKVSISNGKVVCDQSLWRDYLAPFQGECSLEIKKWKKDRTYDQNKLLWKYYEIIADETGNNASDLHEFLKRKLLPPKFIKVMGKEIKIPSSTTGLSTSEFSQYLDKICALTGVSIPSVDSLCG